MASDTVKPLHCLCARDLLNFADGIEHLIVIVYAHKLVLTLIHSDFKNVKYWYMQ